MIVIKPAAELQRGDVFSTDGYEVVSALAIADGRISVEAWLDASGGVSKRAVLAPDFPCPIFIPEDFTHLSDEQIKQLVERVIPQDRPGAHTGPEEYRCKLATEANRRATRRRRGC